MRRIPSVLILVALLVLVLAPWSVVQGVPDDEAKMKKKMQGWSRELGVKCSYCHVQQGRQYDYEAKTPKKEIAHYCEENFVEKLEITDRAVTCADCHGRRPRFLPREGEEAPPPPAPEGAGEGEEKR